MEGNIEPDLLHIGKLVTCRVEGPVGVDPDVVDMLHRGKPVDKGLEILCIEKGLPTCDLDDRIPFLQPVKCTQPLVDSIVQEGVFVILSASDPVEDQGSGNRIGYQALIAVQGLLAAVAFIKAVAAVEVAAVGHKPDDVGRFACLAGIIAPLAVLNIHKPSIHCDPSASIIRKCTGIVKERDKETQGIQEIQETQGIKEVKEGFSQLPLYAILESAEEASGIAVTNAGKRKEVYIKPVRKICMLLITTVLALVFSGLVSGCESNNSKVRELYITSALNAFGQGVDNPDSFHKAVKELYAVVFVNYPKSGYRLEVSMIDKATGIRVYEAATDIQDNRVTYVFKLPNQGWTGSEYEITAESAGKEASRRITLKDDVPAGKAAFVLGDPFIGNTSRYELGTGITNTGRVQSKQQAWYKNVKGSQILWVEVPKTQSGWFRVTWHTPQKELVREEAFYAKDFPGQAGKPGRQYLSISKDYTTDQWKEMRYTASIYQDVYGSPFFTAAIDLLPYNTVEGYGRAAAAESTAEAAATQMVTAAETEMVQTTTALEPQSTTVEPEVETTATEPKAARYRVFMSSGLGEDGKNKDVIREYKYGIKTPLVAVAVTDLPEGSVLGFGLRQMINDAIIASKAEVVEGKAIDGVRYTRTAFELYNKETDNWSPGKYILELYVNEELAATFDFDIKE